MVNNLMWKVLEAVIQLQEERRKEIGPEADDDNYVVPGEDDIVIANRLNIDLRETRDWLNLLLDQRYIAGIKVSSNAIKNINTTPEGRLILKRIKSQPEEIREQILNMIHKHEASGSSAYLDAGKVSEVLGLSIEDVNYHFHVLADEGYITLSETFTNTSGRLTSLGNRRVREGYRLESQMHQFNIGNLISQMHGGNVQGVGLAEQAEIKQIVNDPELFQDQIDDLVNKIIEAVKGELSAEQLIPYIQAVQDLKSEITDTEPQPSRIRQLLSTLAFLGDIEGTLSLMVRIWPSLYLLLTLISAKF